MENSSRLMEALLKSAFASTLSNTVLAAWMIFPFTGAYYPRSGRANEVTSTKKFTVRGILVWTTLDALATHPFWQFRAGATIGYLSWLIVVYVWYKSSERQHCRLLELQFKKEPPAFVPQA